MDIMTAISVATRSIEALNALKNIDKALGEAELKGRAANLLSDVADLKISLLEAREEIARRDAEISKLKASFQLRTESLRHNEMLYEKGPDGKPAGQPFCPRCEQIDGTMIKLTYDEGMRGSAICPQCKAKFRHVTTFPMISAS